MISLFLNLPEAVKSRDETGRTPLHIAAERLQAPMVEALLSAGAEADAQDKVSILTHAERSSDGNCWGVY
jgi:ankyrin repeat protein